MPIPDLLTAPPFVPSAPLRAVLSSPPLASPRWRLLSSWAIDKALTVANAYYGGKQGLRSPPPVPVGPSLPDCAVSKFIASPADCYSFVYSPSGQRWVEALVADVRRQNQPNIAPHRVRGFGSASEVRLFWLCVVPGMLHQSSGRVHSFAARTACCVTLVRGLQFPGTYPARP